MMKKVLAMLMMLLLCLGLASAANAMSPMDTGGGRHDITLLSTGIGSVGMEPNVPLIPYGQTVCLTITPAEGYAFSHV